MKLEKFENKEYHSRHEYELFVINKTKTIVLKLRKNWRNAQRPSGLINHL